MVDETDNSLKKAKAELAALMNLSAVLDTSAGWRLVLDECEEALAAAQSTLENCNPLDARQVGIAQTRAYFNRRLPTLVETMIDTRRRFVEDTEERQNRKHPEKRTDF